MCSYKPTNRAQVFLPHPEREDTATCLFSKPQRQQKLNRPRGWHETGPSQGDKKCLSSEPAEFRQKNPNQKKNLNQTREAMVALPVWDWHLIPGTEESNKHSRRSGEQIWEGIFARFPYCNPSALNFITKRERYGSADIVLTFNAPPIPFANSQCCTLCMSKGDVTPALRAAQQRNFTFLFYTHTKPEDQTACLDLNCLVLLRLPKVSGNLFQRRQGIPQFHVTFMPGKSWLRLAAALSAVHKFQFEASSFRFVVVRNLSCMLGNLFRRATGNTFELKTWLKLPVRDICGLCWTHNDGYGMV